MPYLLDSAKLRRSMKREAELSGDELLFLESLDHQTFDNLPTTSAFGAAPFPEVFDTLPGAKLPDYDAASVSSCEESGIGGYFQDFDPGDLDGLDDLDGDEPILGENEGEPLYPGALFTLPQILILLGALGRRFSLSNECLSAIAILVAAILPDGNKLYKTTSSYKLRKFFKSHVPDEWAVQRFCKNKHAMEGTRRSCQVCSNKADSRVVVVPISSRLRSAVNMLTTIPERLDLTFGFDGVQCFKVSANGLWVLFIKVMNTPIRLIYSLWLGRGYPPLDLVFSGFADEINTLQRVGLACRNGVAAVKLQMGLADWQARAHLKCYKHSGYESCQVILSF